MVYRVYSAGRPWIGRATGRRPWAAACFVGPQL